MKYNLNEQSLLFVCEFERTVSSGEVHSNKELVEKFKCSIYYSDQINTYYSTAMSKAIWWAIKRSGNWLLIQRGKYQKN